MDRYHYGAKELKFIEESPVPIAVYQFVDKRVVTIAISKGAVETFGLDSLEDAYYLMDNDMYRDVHPDDIAMIADAAVRFATIGGEYDVVYRTRVNGKYLILHAIGYHFYTETGEKLAVHKWKFMGITFSNNETYDDIVNSMNELKQMRENNLNEENVREYKEEYNHLRDLCAQYIVSHRRKPWTDDGKERLKMVKTVWESMSNADENVLDTALQIDGQGQKISNVNIHRNDRRKVSYDELLNENADRKERIREHKVQKAQRNAERQNNGPDRGMN